MTGWRKPLAIQCLCSFDATSNFFRPSYIFTTLSNSRVTPGTAVEPQTFTIAPDRTVKPRANAETKIR